MTRPRLRSPDQPRWLRLILGLYEFFASLQLAVVLIALFAVVLAWATLLESDYGDRSRAVYYGIYETWWFSLLGASLGLNVLCAALIRYPWKRSQTGFLVVHSGILLLLLGALLSRRGGVDANLPVFEGRSQHLATQNSEQFRLAVYGSGGKPQVVRIPFVAGPFNWEDYQHKFWLPWILARRDRGVIYDRDGIKLEVLDYLADSIDTPVPSIRLRVAGTRGGMEAGDESVMLSVRDASMAQGFERPYGLGRRKTLADGRRVAFWMTGDRGETDAFRIGPQGKLGRLGQLVLYAAGQAFHFPLDKLPVKEKQPLGKTGLTMELVQHDPRTLTVQVRIAKGDDAPHEMVLLADFPEFNGHDYRHGVFGQYWADPTVALADAEPDSQASRMVREAASPRIDILQGADRKLYARLWQASTLSPVVELSPGGKPATVGPEMSPAAVVVVQEYLPADKPGTAVAPLPFNRNKNASEKQRQARVRLTVDGHSDEFWLAGCDGDPGETPLPASQQRWVESPQRRVSLALPWDTIDIGFRVRLVKFTRKLDPGTSTASHYSSLVEFRDVRDPEKKLWKEPVLITLNEPINFSDPVTGRSYRLYQSSFNGPFQPGDPAFEQIVQGGELRKELFVSHFTVNYDPGRGLKYAGCLMIVLGTVVIFYMKSVFVHRKRTSSRRVPTGASAGVEPQTVSS